MNGDCFMKRKKILFSLFVLATFILELIPNGAVLNFANPEGDSWRRTYSYFSMTPFGYANFGPLFTAILTCVLIVLVCVSWFKFSKRLNRTITIISGIATAISLLPLMFGIEHITVIGIIITVLLAATFAASFIKENK